MDTIYLIEQFVSTHPGTPFRLFPFGTIVKGGKRREITPELAAKFRLPHFKPPVKLGSHDDTTPAGGHIIGLEMRSDGLYAIPEFTDRGVQALADGAYRYHSPEIVWEGGLEDPVTGETIQGPLIVGDALLHTPHLGEMAALYTYEQKEQSMNDETIQVPRTLWDKFTAWFSRRVDEAEQPVTEDPVPPAPAPVPEEYAAKIAELEQYKARIDAMEAAAARQAQIDAYKAELAGASVDVDEWSAILVDLPPATAQRVVQAFRALSTQIAANDQLTRELGSDAERPAVTGPAAQDIAIKAYAAEHKVGYIEAFKALRASNPELFISA